MFGRLCATVFGAVAGLGLVAAGAVTLPERVAAVAAGLERSGYTDVRVTERIFGGFAIQGKKGTDFAIIALDADGKMLNHAELFRDVDGDGVFESTETLGMPGRATLRNLILDALDEPPSNADRDLAYGDANAAGFQQNMDSLFAPGGLRLDAGERLGSGGIATKDEVSLLNADGNGMQRRGERREQQQSMVRQGVLSLSATATNLGGVTGSFAPLAIDVGSAAAAEEIRNSVSANAPDQAALQSAITAASPSAAELTQQILSATPTAESIRAGITAPTAP